MENKQELIFIIIGCSIIDQHHMCQMYTLFNITVLVISIDYIITITLPTL